MDVKIEQSWKKELQSYFDSSFQKLAEVIKKEYSVSTIYPPATLIFNAFDSCPFEKVKVVILGQDPYHGAKQAHGLSFSVPDGIAPPPSLENIFKEIHDDLQIPTPKSGNLKHWAEQGVFLLNSILTVRANSPASHQKKGWEEFTDYVIEKLATKKRNLVFMLWGKYAQEKGSFIDRAKHLILEATHPSPYSANYGFFGCKHFSQCNDYLKKHNKTPIQW